MSGEESFHRCGSDLHARPGERLDSLVVLVGLGSVYAHGLCGAVSGIGIACCCVRGAGDLPGVLRTASAVLVAAPADLVGAVLERVPPDRRAAVRLAVLLPDREPDSYARALHRGAVGLVPHDSELPDVLHVLSSAHRGRTVLPVAVVRALTRAAPALGSDLSETERTWLTELASGRTVGDLARRHSYSEREMYRVLARLYRRLGVPNRSAALIAAQRAGLLK